MVVFGATGGTGLALVQLALEKGYAVRAFVRNSFSLARELGDLAGHAALEVTVSNLTDLAAVEAAVAGARAVICLAGAKPETAPGPLGEAVPAMVAGCRKYGVRKLIVQTCAMSIMPGERVGWLTQGTLIRTIVKWQLGSTVIDDNDRVIQFLHRETRDLDWVISRPAGLMDGERLGPLAPSLDQFRAATVRYIDVADWTLLQVESDAYVGKMPRLYYPPAQHPI